MTRIHVEPGTEKWLQYALQRLRALDALRQRLGLPKLSRAWRPDATTLVWMVASRFGNWVRITGGGSLWFGIRPDTGVGVVAQYGGSDSPATLVREEPTVAGADYGVWSRDGRATLLWGLAGNASSFYREGVFQIEFPGGDDAVGAFSMPDNFAQGPQAVSFRRIGQISDDASVAVVSAFKAELDSLARFAEWDEGLSSYAETDPGAPDFASITTSTVSNFDSATRQYYVDLPSLAHGQTIRLRMPQIVAGVYINPYDARELYVVVLAELIASVTTINGANSRAWELDVRQEWHLFRYVLGAGWTDIGSTNSETRKYTVVDQSWAAGGPGEQISVNGDTPPAADIDPFGGTGPQSAASVNYIEPWFRVDGTRHNAVHETVGSISQTVTDPYQLQDSPLLEIIRYGVMSTSPVSDARILLDGVEFVAGLGAPELAGEQAAFLRHLGVGDRALLTMPAGGTKWVLPSGVVALGADAVLSIDGDRAYVGQDFSSATEFWVDGVKVLEAPADTYSIRGVSVENDEQLVLGTGDQFTSTVVRVATLRQSISGWEVSLGDYVPDRVAGVEVEFDDPFTGFWPQLAVPKVKPDVVE